MRTNRLSRLWLVIAAFMTVSCEKDAPQLVQSAPVETLEAYTVFASGLFNPRGLEFGPDGNLYVAEGGVGGTTSTVGQCEQVPFLGPYFGSPVGGRISRISPAGERTTVSDQFPSSIPTADPSVSGVADIGFCGKDLYALVTGGGCSHGVPQK